MYGTTALPRLRLVNLEGQGAFPHPWPLPANGGPQLVGGGGGGGEAAAESPDDVVAHSLPLGRAGESGVRVACAIMRIGRPEWGREHSPPRVALVLPEVGEEDGLSATADNVQLLCSKHNLEKRDRIE